MSERDDDPAKPSPDEPVDDPLDKSEATIVERNVFVRVGPSPDDDAESGGWSLPIPKEDEDDPDGGGTRRTKIEHITARDHLLSDEESAATPADDWASRPERSNADDKPTQIHSESAQVESAAAKSDDWGPPPEELSSSTGSVSVALVEEDRTDSGEHIDDGESPRLICIEGPDQGTEFILRGRDIAIGRGPNVDVTTKDPSMSRVHCRILITPDQIVVTDQRSANGTIVNGRKIDRATIVSGATLKLGQSQFRFVEMGDVIKPAETNEHELPPEPTPIAPDLGPMPQQPRRYALAIVVASIVIALLVVVINTYRSHSAQKAVRQANEAAEEFLTRGIDALRSKRVNDACQSFRHAALLAPTERRFADHVALCEAEVKAVELLDQAEKDLAAGKLRDAFERLAPVPDTSVYSNDKKLLNDRVRGARADILAQLKRQVAAGAGPELEPKLRAIDFLPGDMAIEELVAQLDRNKKKPGKQNDAGKPKPNNKPDPTPTAPPAPANKVVAAFNSGDLDGALGMVQGSSDNDVAMRNKLTKFRETFETAKAGGGSAANLGAIRRAVAFEAKIGNGSSTFFKELKKLEADALFQVGVAAQGERKFPEAYRAFREAQAAVPGYPPAQRKFSELAGQARDLFNQGYIVKDSDLEGARNKWKQVLAMVPPEDEIYQKAKKWLDQTGK